MLRDAQVFTREGGIAALTVVMIAVLATLVLHSARVLRRVDREREVLLVRERELRESAEAARSEAEAANRVKSEFLATMSHELRTPLNAIIGYSSLMQEGLEGKLNPTQRRYVGRVRVSADHLLTLIDQILTLAKLEAEKSAIRKRPVSIEELVGDAVAIAEPILLGRGLRLAVHADADGSIRTDSDRVRQILLNLLSNAAKFTDEGNVVLRTLRVGPVAEPGGRGSPNGRVVFEVTDSGIGIAPEHHERIFEPFWQVEMQTTRRYEGAGLGLSVSRELARLLGGDLTVRSAPGEGATFTLELPDE
jgi:signal transduction histidine kinase